MANLSLRDKRNGDQTYGNEASCIHRSACHITRQERLALDKTTDEPLGRFDQPHNYWLPTLRANFHC